MIDLDKMENKFEEILQTENLASFQRWQKEQEIKKYKFFVGEGRIEFFKSKTSHFISVAIDVKHIFSRNEIISDLDYELAA